MHRSTTLPLILSLFGLLCLGLCGCSGLSSPWRGSSAAIEIRSTETQAALRPNLPHRLYRHFDPNSADVILTDIDPAVLADGATMPQSGQILHLHFFVRPRPGRTPIAQTACSTTVRHIIISRGEIGVYVGGGFLIPSEAPGGKTFAGSIGTAPLRLARATGAFTDRLGSSEASISFNSTRDDATVQAAIAMIDRLAYIADPIVPAGTLETPEPEADAATESESNAAEPETSDTPEQPAP